MILTCPQCSTRYQADVAKFQPAGRKVRCAKCGHVWHQGPQEDEQEPIAEPAETPSAETAPDLGPSDAMRPAAVSMASTSRGWQVSAIAGWLSFAVVVGLVIWAAIAFRQQIVQAWPKTTAFYTRMGFDVNTFGIAFRDVSYRIASHDDMPVLFVRGKLVNITHHEMPVPKVRVGLISDSGADVYHWDVDAGVKTLTPGQIAEFHTRLASPPTGGRHLQLKFVPAGK